MVSCHDPHRIHRPTPRRPRIPPHLRHLDLWQPTVHDVHPGPVTTEDPAVVTWHLAIASYRHAFPRPTRRHWWRDLVTEAWRCADQAWLLAREAEAIGYPTEEAEFARHTPRPRLQDFMVHLSTGSMAPDRLEVGP